MESQKEEEKGTQSESKITSLNQNNIKVELNHVVTNNAHKFKEAQKLKTQKP